VFADVLGFASLTESNPLDVDRLKLLAGPIGDRVWEQIEANKDPLAATFVNFHQAIKFANDLAAMHHSVTSITFSDSAFFATAHLFEAVYIARHLLLHLIWQKVPVRIGIAFGTLAVLGFESKDTPAGRINAAHFLGTAVVRAQRTESCGLKGMRILLHPSAASLLTDPRHNPAGAVQTLECPEDPADNTAGVSREINYWPDAPTEEKRIWASLQDMWDNAPPVARRHYHATATAINRMRTALGEPPLETLRRRTLPRRARPRSRNQRSQQALRAFDTSA
jgi:hypothetical protein